MVDWFAVAVSVLGHMVAGVIGNRTDALFCQCWQTIYERLRKVGSRDNHDLQQAIRKAILQATLCLLSDALKERGRDKESQWLSWVYNELTAELGRVSSAEDVPPSSAAENELALLLQPQGVTAEERAKELQERVTDEWLNELRERFGEPPEIFVKRLREGWQPPKETKQVFWFNLVRDSFAHEINHNQRVAYIVMVKLLAELKLGEQFLREALTDYLERKFALILQRLDDIKQQLDELERQQREGFEELKERQAEIIAILLTVRASLSEVAQWVRLIAESMAEIPVAKDLDRETRRFLQDKWREGFVGRKEAVERLNRFIATNPNGVAIVYAPAGYGKTTFLAHWIKQVEETGGWLSEDGETVVEVVSHFFNQAVDSSALRPSNAYAHLLAQLVLFSDQPIRIRFRISEDDWRADLRNFLADSLKLPEGVKLVIVLDGLDDAEGEVKPFIPSRIPEGLFVVVSGRWDGEGELPNYLKEWAKFTEFIPLKALSEEELREWLRTAGEGELARFAENDDFVRMLREKTDGLPLFVRYLMDDLLQAVKEGKSPEQVLERTPKGFSEYVKEQLDELEQSKLIQELEQRVGSKIWDLFALLTVTKGALRQDEVEALTGFPRRELRRLPHQVTRWFSIGKTHSSADMPTADLPTYSFAHPLLAEEFRKHLGKEARQMEERLLKWCENWREHPSFPYILRHYAEHLYEKCPMTNERMTNEQMTNYAELCRLALDSDFKQAQTKHLPDEPNLPLKTVQLALDAAIQLEDALTMARLLIEHAKRAQSEAETPLQAWRKGHRERALELATDFVFKRDHKLGTLWSLLLAWVAESEGEREWSKRFLDELRKRWERAGSSVELHRWQGEMAAFLLDELKQVEGSMQVERVIKIRIGGVWILFDEYERDKINLVENLISNEFFDQALKVAEEIKNARERAEALAAIAKKMAKAKMKKQAEEIYERALQEMAKEDEEIWRTLALKEIAEGIARSGMKEQAEEIYNQALKVAEGIESARARSMVLKEVAEGMTKVGMEERAKEVFDQALKAAGRIENEWGRATALNEIREGMERAGIEERAEEIIEMIEETGTMKIIQVSKIVEEIIKEVGIDQALKKVEEINKRVKLPLSLRLLLIMAILEEIEKIKGFKQILKLVKEIEDVEGQAWVWVNIAAKIAKVGMEKRVEKIVEKIYDQALKAAEGIKWATSRARVLWTIAVGMTKAGMRGRAQEIFDQALKVAEGIEEAWERARALREIAEEMAKEGMFDQALKVAEGIEEARWRARALREIAGEMAKAGEVEGAVGIVEREMAVRTEGLPSVLSALAERARKGDGRSKEGFLKLLPLCGWSLEFAYKACGLLAWLYPERGEEIAGVIAATGD
jgi:tetratricopeptide (TPR) repeat protein